MSFMDESDVTPPPTWRGLMRHLIAVNSVREPEWATPAWWQRGSDLANVALLASVPIIVVLLLVAGRVS